MATLMQKMKRVPHYLPTGTHRTRPTIKSTLTGFVVDKGERYGAGYAFGYLKGMYGPKFIWREHSLEMWIGGGALVLSMLGHAFGYHNAAEHFERVGDSGLTVGLASLGAAMGMQKSGRKMSPPMVLGAGGKSVVGAIPPAAPGSFLSAEDIARFANRR